MLELISVTISIAVGLGVIIDRWSPRVGNFALFKTRRDVRQMIARGSRIDYAGRWRYSEGLHSIVVRDATKAELRYLRIEPEPIDAAREISGFIA